MYTHWGFRGLTSVKGTFSKHKQRFHTRKTVYKSNSVTDDKVSRSRSRHYILARGLVAAFIALSATLLSATRLNLVRADPLPVVNKSGTLSSNETWTSGNVYLINGQLTVPDNVTLTINAGAIVKYAAWTNITITSGGTVIANGTSGSPIIFTSDKDDSAGGDSNGDGTATSPAFGDYPYAFTTNSFSSSTASLSVSHADIRYGSQPITIDCIGNDDMSVTVADSIIKGQVSANWCGQGIPSLQRNQFELPSGSSYEAIYLQHSDPSGIVLAGTNKNTFTGSGKTVAVLVQDATVSSGSTWDISGASGAIVEPANISVAGTVSFDSGAIVKVRSGIGVMAFNIISGGELNATGTSMSPVIFTSEKDDSVGGDTNGDGNATSPAFGDYSYVIRTNPWGSGNASDAAVVVSHAEFRYANEPISPNCTGDTGMSVAVSDSLITGRVWATACGLGVLSLQRNQFEVPSGSGYQAVYVNSGGDPSGIVLAGTNKNTFTGTGKSVVVLVQNGTVGSTSTWTVDGTSGAIVEPSYVSVNGTVDLGTGAIVKVEGSSPAFVVGSAGTFTTAGTSQDPVIFTSIKDDSIGGDTNGDGASSGATADYGTAVRFNEPSSSDGISYTVFKYASSAGAVSSGASGTLNIDHTQFTANVSAIASDTTSTNNPALGALEEFCLYPYANQIHITNSWFGTSGDPGIAFDMQDYLGLSIGDDFPGLQELYGAVSTLHETTVPLGSNTIPTSLFTCGIPDGPTIIFPVTPVNWWDFPNPAIVSSKLWTASNL